MNDSFPLSIFIKWGGLSVCQRILLGSRGFAFGDDGLSHCFPHLPTSNFIRQHLVVHGISTRVQCCLLTACINHNHEIPHPAHSCDTFHTAVSSAQLPGNASLKKNFQLQKMPIFLYIAFIPPTTRQNTLY